MIPNKAFQALACGMPLVTADTRAARELLVDGKSALLVPPGDAERPGRTRSPGSAATPSSRADRRRRPPRRTATAASEEVLGERWRTLLASLL